MKPLTVLLVLLLPILCLAQARRHPTLVDPAKANCSLCHREMTEGKVHPIVEEGCDNCHEMTVKDGKTLVSLTANGNDLCLMCHDDKSRWDEKKGSHPALDDCLNCHKPHASKNDHLLKEKLPDLCFSCHDKDEIRKEIHKGQPVHATQCIICHDPHGSDEPHALKSKDRHPPFDEGSCDACHRKTRTRKARLRTSMPNLCYACHGDLQEAFKKSVVHDPVRRGKCTACHDPHQGKTVRFLKAKAPKLCFTCHPDIEKAMGEKRHSPAQEECFTCHDPHATDAPHLIKAEMMEGGRIASLCANCHDLDELKPIHRGAEMADLDCTTCHNPHGSKEKHLINETTIHPPFQEECDTCHGEGTDLTEEEPDLCFMCHDDIRESVKKAVVAHPAVGMGCTSCHTPHASAEKRLFKGPQVEVCGACHEMNYPVYHGVIATMGCQACHEPHGGEGKKLLKAEGNALCLRCHDADAPGETLPEGLPSDTPKVKLNRDKSRGHPVIGHPVTGKPVNKRKKVTLPEGVTELSCLSCHNPHGGKSPKLYAYGKVVRYELCNVCHKK